MDVAEGAYPPLETTVSCSPAVERVSFLVRMVEIARKEKEPQGVQRKLDEHD